MLPNSIIKLLSLDLKDSGTEFLCLSLDSFATMRLNFNLKSELPKILAKHNKGGTRGYKIFDVRQLIKLLIILRLRNTVV